MPIWDFSPYSINELLEIRSAARKLATFELGLDDEALEELNRTIKKHLKETKRIVCINCGEIDAVSFGSEPDEYDWNEKSQTYELASNEQGCFTCTECGLPVCAKIDGDDVVPSDQEDLLEGVLLPLENENEAAKKSGLN